MFKYVKFEKVETEFTVLEFKGGDDKVKVNHFDKDAVSVEAESEVEIDALISSQVSEINCKIITHDEFKELVENSAQLKRIRAIVKSKISDRYDIADEVAMTKKDATDEKRVEYEAYVLECLSLGFGLKSEIGY